MLNIKQDSGSVGYTLGIKDRVTDPENFRAACYYGKGLSAGISLAGNLFIGNKTLSSPTQFNFDKFELNLSSFTHGNKSELTLSATDEQKHTITLSDTFIGELDGLVALENNILESEGSTFWCSDIELMGTKVVYEKQNSYGPILWSMYTLSNNKVKLSANSPPIGEKDSKTVELQMLKDNKWIKVGKANIHPVSYTALFEINNWDSKIDVPFKLTYQIDGYSHIYDGLIRKEPEKALKFAGLTCQHWGGYPYTPLVKNLEKTNPDFLYFSGDQIYEENGGYPIKREPEAKAILNYLGKWYMFGWTFGNIMRDRPTVCTPDDHDVFQGNLWGEGGNPVSFELWEKVKDAHGGFVQTPKMINVINQTQCGHLPNPYQKEKFTLRN